MDRPAGHLPLQESAFRRFRDSLEHTSRIQNGKNPLGLCFIGPAVAGKTHLLGEIRRAAAQLPANFVLSDLTDIREFWPLLAMHFLQSIQRPMNGVRQLQRILEVLLCQVDDPPSAMAFIERGRLLPREGLLFLTKKVISSLRPIYGQEILRRERVFRALMYLESEDAELSERAYSFLQGDEQIDEKSREFRLHGSNSPKSVVIDLAWFLSLTGPTVLAFDQLDPFVAQNNLAGLEKPSSPRLAEAFHILSGVVNGIMAVREECARTLVVLSCLESTWKLLQQRVESFQGRFEPTVEKLQLIRDRETPSKLVALRLEESYRLAGFTPPYPEWPFAQGFFATLPPGLTPREILNRCAEHQTFCLRAGKVAELLHYSDSKKEPVAVDLSSVEADFAKTSATIDTAGLLDESREDALGDLLGEAAKLFRHELPFDPNVDIAVESDFHETRQYESLHLRLRRIFRLERDREEHVCVRILQKTHHTSFKVRLTAAMTTSGVSEMLDGRRLFLVRTSQLPGGAKTAEMVKRAQDCGAGFIPLSEEDTRIIAAVVKLSTAGAPLFESWLLQKRPLSGTRLFRQLVPTWLDVAPQLTQPVAERDDRRTSAKTNGRKGEIKHRTMELKEAAMPAIQPPALPISRKGVLLGSRFEAGSVGDSIYMPLADLTRHVIIRAGSGGGKTVFIKRLVEEAALCGISAIVIDTAKDLSMLGDRWQQPPANWAEEDAQLAEQYHRSVDVRIWTPGHTGGRPLRLAPLPNLSGPFHDSHDREQVVQIAVAGLLPLAVQKKSATVERAILKRVVEWLTRQPQHTSNELERLIAALRDLPGEAYQGYQKERKIAAGMADQVQAAQIADPLYGGQGEDLDPAVLLGVGCSRARVSVLSLFAMPDINTQARFIGQLASVLFNWIRRNPAPEESGVRGLMVLDEAARFLPRNNAESKAGLMLLAQQARKYGLGLVMATQNPKELDYNATANFATQIFGTAAVPQVVKYIQEAMEQRGLSGMNPGILKTGEFFCATPSLPLPIRLRAAMCLSAHPQSVQLSDEDILARASRNAE
jgi:hypothetical protein